MSTKKVIGAGLLAGALMAGAVGIAGPASATNYYPSGSKGDQSVAGYYHDLVAEGVGGSLSSASSLGQTICGQLQAGTSESDLISTAKETPGLSLTLGQAKVVVWSAEWHFCPSYY